MADESHNALLKTLEEPPPFAHLILLSAEPAGLLETVVSRCQEVRFARLSAEVVERRLAADGIEGPEVAAAARLCGGDAGRARLLVSEPGRELRGRAEACARGARSGELGDRPWMAVLAAADEAGEAEGERVAQRIADAAEGADPKEASRIRRESEESGKRAARARRTEVLDLSLALCGAWFRDLAAVAEGAPELAMNVDRLDELRADAEGLDPRAARRAGELVLETRRNLQVNIAEELALEALLFRSEALLR
jgi:DNA polymerase III subunit delta'